MDPDLVHVTPEENRWLDFKGAKLPQNTVVAGEKPVSMTFARGGKTIGVVIFPALPLDADNAPPAMERAVVDAAAALRQTADLVVGMSSWGEKAEAHFLVAQDHDLHVLLGSGPGNGLLGRLTSDDKSLWVRAYSRGIALNRIDVLKWPSDDAGWAWSYGTNFMVRILPLGDDWPLDMTVHGLLSPFPKNIGG
jgi:hypothetical protein